MKGGIGGETRPGSLPAATTPVKQLDVDSSCFKFLAEHDLCLSDGAHSCGLVTAGNVRREKIPEFGRTHWSMRRLIGDTPGGN
jgi:hypothetical protein